MARVALTRDSVCMGDDVLAPNAGAIDVPDDATLAEVAQAVMDARYLASIAGGSASWYAMAGCAAVVFGWVRDRPFLHALGGASPAARDLAELHIRYAAQDSPEAVVARIASRLAG